MVRNRQSRGSFLLFSYETSCSQRVTDPHRLLKPFSLPPGFTCSDIEEEVGARVHFNPSHTCRETVRQQRSPFGRKKTAKRTTTKRISALFRREQRSSKERGCGRNRDRPSNWTTVITTARRAALQNRSEGAQGHEVPTSQEIQDDAWSKIEA